MILSLDADFLACGSPGRTADERAYAAKRTPKEGVMNRLYSAESAYTNTGASADHRLAIKPSLFADLALAVAKEVGVEGATPGTLPEATAKWAAAVGKDLKKVGKKALVLVGDSQPAYVHAVGIAINQALGSIGPEGTISYIEPIEADPVDHLASLVELAKGDMEAGKVDTLVIIGGNPAYTAPVDLKFAQSAQEGLQRFPSGSVCTWTRTSTEKPMRLAHPRGSFPRDMERCPSLRRHRGGRPAVDLTALQRAEVRSRDHLRMVMMGQFGPLAH